MVYSQWKARVPGGQDMAHWSCLILRFDLAARDLGCQSFYWVPRGGDMGLLSIKKSDLGVSWPKAYFLVL